LTLLEILSTLTLSCTTSESKWELLDFSPVTKCAWGWWLTFGLQVFRGWTGPFFDNHSFLNTSLLRNLDKFTCNFNVSIQIESNFFSNATSSTTPLNLTNPKRWFLLLSFLEMKMSKTLPHIWKTFQSSLSRKSFGKFVKKYVVSAIEPTLSPLHKIRGHSKNKKTNLL